MSFVLKSKYKKFVPGFILIFILSLLFSNMFFLNNSNKFNLVKASVKSVNSKKAKTVKKTKFKKTAYLTFDDGPSVNTDKVLKILDKYKIKATFFVVGLNTDKAAVNRLKKILKKGHNIGLHSMTHNYKQVYASLAAFKRMYMQFEILLKKVRE